MFNTIRATLLACISIAALAACAAPVRPEKASVAQVAAVRSVASSSPAKIRFVNNSGQPVKVSWIDFQGRRQLYATLNNRETYVQETYLDHPWLVTDAGDNVWYLFFADAQPRTIVILAPAPN